MNSHRRFFALLSSFLAALILTGCDQVAVATPQPVTLTIAGSTAMQPVLAALSDTFSQEHPNVLFDIRGGGSTLGESRLRAAEIDIAASTLLPPTMRTDGETIDDPPTDQAETSPDALIHTPIGLDGIAVVVNEQNPIESLTIQQLRDLFNGRTLDWSSLNGLGDETANGVDSDILLVSREDGSGTRGLFEERIMGDEAVSLTAVVMPSSADVVDYVTKHPLAIGYVSEAYVAKGHGAGSEGSGGDSVRIVGVEGRYPDAAIDGEEPYFLTRPLFLVTNGEPSGWSRQFVDFVLGPSGQEIVDQYHARIR